MEVLPGNHSKAQAIAVWKLCGLEALPYDHASTHAIAVWKICQEIIAALKFCTHERANRLRI